MKTLNSELRPEAHEINWSKPQWVRFIENNGLIVLTNGNHTPTSFSGTSLPCSDYPDGFVDGAWSKSNFVPITGTIMFPISNDND